MNNKYNTYQVYKYASLLFLLDQLIKYIVHNTMNLYDEIKIIPNFFSIYFVQNTGAAFSILEDATLVLIIISIVFIIIIDRLIKKEKENLDKLSIIALGMVIGGIFGNLIDRILYRSVIDYISLEFFSYHFPVFNIADMGITIGVLLLLIDLIKRRKES